MARRLDAFPDHRPSTRQKYPWEEWIDGSVWEIRQGNDYDVATENMRVNLHMKADAQSRKVRTKKVRDEDGEGLIFQFLDSEEEQQMKVFTTEDPHGAQQAMDTLYRDADELYERARHEVVIPRSDGTTQKYAAVRYKQQIDKGYVEGTLVPTIARIIRRPTLGFSHLTESGREDLLLENLVLDTAKPYHRFFTPQTVHLAKARMDEYRRSQGSELIPPDDEVTPFSDDEAAYLDWIDQHPSGYVVNTERTPRPSYLQLHVATCRHIAKPREPGAYTERQYVKFCSTSRHALEEWAEDEIGGHLRTGCTCLS